MGRLNAALIFVLAWVATRMQPVTVPERTGHQRFRRQGLSVALDLGLILQREKSHHIGLPASGDNHSV